MIGGGDANLSNRKFPFGKKEERDGPPEKALAEFAEPVAARGVKEIAGDVIADDSLFQPERFPSGWAIDDMQWSYGAAVSAIAVNDNTFTVELWPGAREGEPARIRSRLRGRFLYDREFGQTTAPGIEEKSGRRARSRLAVDSRQRHDPRRRASARADVRDRAARRIRRDACSRICSPSAASRSMAPPAPAMPATRRPPTWPPQTILAERISLPLSDDVRLTNKNSENLHAELMLLLAAHEKTGATSYEEAAKFAAAFFMSAGIAAGDVSLSDGSGLSRKDLVTPRAIVQMLRYAAAQPWGELYRSSLPVAGEDGTLSDRMKNTPAAGRVFAKTGTIGHTNAISGYARPFVAST